MLRRRPTLCIDGIRLDPEASQAILRGGHRRVPWPHRVAWWTAAALPVLAVASLPAAASLYSAISSIAVALVVGAGFGLGFGLYFGQVLPRVFAHVFRREVREAMRARGYTLCPGCGYWLHGHGGADDDAGARCPECGVALPGPVAPG